MNTAVRLSEEIIQKARIRSEAMERSISKQIEYWAKIGKIAEENPDLPYSFIKDILLGQQEAATNHH
jgi:hypothetical protein